MIVRNREELLSHGNKKGRAAVLDVIEHAIRSVDAYEAAKESVRVEDGRLVVAGSDYLLSEVRNIYVVGGGKATFSIAKALDEVLGEKIMKGVINVKRGEKRRLKHVDVIEAGHPIPDRRGLEGVRKMIDIAKEAKSGDLVFCAITGGASALMPLPAADISLTDKRRVTELLLKCGATIDEINTVRKHISAIKGGRLAKYIHPAKIVNLIVIDEISGRLWGPTVPDTTTFEDAINVLGKYDLWKKAPDSVKEYLEMGLADRRLETPKPENFKKFKVHNVVLADNDILCGAAKRRAEELGFESSILSTKLEGESKETGIVLASIAKEIENKGRFIKPPCILVLGGETTVKITGHHGKGGPSQELALGASLKIAGSKKIVIASTDTDGTDGPTNIAGGIVDGYTMERARKEGVDIYKNLIEHDSSEVLLRLQDAIFTGPTGTNVMDLNILVITS